MFTLNQLVDNNTLSQDMALFLKSAVENNVSVLFSGLPGTGKTVLMKSLIPYITSGSLLAYDSKESQGYGNKLHFCDKLNLNSTVETHKTPVQRILSKNPDYVVIDDERSIIDTNNLSDTGSTASWTPLCQLMSRVGVMSTISVSIKGYSPDYLMSLSDEKTLNEEAPQASTSYIVALLDFDHETQMKHKVTSIHEVYRGISEMIEIEEGIFIPTQHKTLINTLYNYSTLEDAHYSLNDPTPFLRNTLSNN